MNPSTFSPMRLYTLRDMLRFSAAKFQELMRSLQELKCEYGWQLVPREGTIDADLATRTEIVIGVCLECCESLDLKSSKAAIKRYLPAIRSWDLWTAVNAVKDIDSRIQDELEAELFLYVPSIASKLYLNQFWIGEDVLKAFPGVASDALEAATCYALERYTASVFHLMRILEHGLASLAASLKVPIVNPNWHQILVACENQIKDLMKIDPTWRVNERFYNEAALEFRHFQRALRNHTAHAHSHYGQDEAKTAMDHVKSFMRHIASRLSEVPLPD
jgi:hypothetical protein